MQYPQPNLELLVSLKVIDKLPEYFDLSVKLQPFKSLK